MPKLASILLAIATASGAIFEGVLQPLPASAKMDTIEEEQYHETVEAAQTLVKSKHWPKAEAKYNEAREQALKNDDKKRQALAIERLGSIAYEQADYKGAAERFKAALDLADSEEQVGEGLKAEYLFNLANALMKLNKESEARPYLSRCLEISRKIYSPNHPNLAVRTAAYARLLSLLGEKEESKKLAGFSQVVINKFMEDTSTKIKKAWQPPAENFSYRLTVKYDVLNQGKVDNLEVVKSSGSSIADKAGIAAIKAAAPFADIESSDADDKVELAFSFDYNYNSNKNHDQLLLSSTNQSVAPSALKKDKKERHQSREEQNETEVKIKEASGRSAALKEQIEKLAKSTAEDAAVLAPLYVQYADSLIVQGKWQEAAQQLMQALEKPCFKKNKGVPSLSLSIALAHTFLSQRTLGNPEPILQSAIADKKFKETAVKLQKQALEDYGHCLSRDQQFAQAQDYYTRAQELPE